MICRYCSACSARFQLATEMVASISGDGVYDTKGCCGAITQREAQAMISTRKNAKVWKDHRPGHSP